MGGRRGPGSWPEPGCLLEALSEPGGRRAGLDRATTHSPRVRAVGAGPEEALTEVPELWFNHSQINLPPAPSPHRPGCFFFL